MAGPADTEWMQECLNAFEQAGSPRLCLGLCVTSGHASEPRGVPAWAVTYNSGPAAAGPENSPITKPAFPQA